MVVYILLAFLLIFPKFLVSKDTANEFEDGSVCKWTDKDCFFKRYSNLKLPRINPVKVSKQLKKQIVRIISLVKVIRQN